MTRCFFYGDAWIFKKAVDNERSLVSGIVPMHKNIWCKKRKHSDWLPVIIKNVPEMLSTESWKLKVYIHDSNFVAFLPEGSIENEFGFISSIYAIVWHRMGNRPLPGQIFSPLNALRPRQNRRHFPDDIFRCIFVNENIWISIKIAPKFVPQGPISNIQALVQIMACCGLGVSRGPSLRIIELRPGTKTNILRALYIVRPWNMWYWLYGLGWNSNYSQELYIP